METYFETSDISLTSYFLTQGIVLIEIVRKTPFRFDFQLSDLAKCNQLKRDYLNGAMAPAQELFSKRELLISQIRSFK